MEKLYMKHDSNPRDGVKSNRGKIEILLKFFIAIFLTWGVAVLTVYSMDLPSQGGADAFCESFYVAPANPNDPVYPYDNTFNISTPIDWSNSGGPDALDKHR